MTINESLDNYISKLLFENTGNVANTNSTVVMKDINTAEARPIKPTRQAVSTCPKCGSKDVKLIDITETADPSDCFGDDIAGNEYRLTLDYICNKCGCAYSDLRVEFVTTKIQANNQGKINKFLYDNWDDLGISWNLVGIPYDENGKSAFECQIESGIDSGELSNTASLKEQKDYFLHHYDSLLKRCAADFIKAADNLSAIYDSKTYKYSNGKNSVAQAKAYNIDEEALKRGLKYIWNDRKDWAINDNNFGPVKKSEVEALYNKYRLPF